MCPTCPPGERAGGGGSARALPRAARGWLSCQGPPTTPGPTPDPHDRSRSSLVAQHLVRMLFDQASRTPGAVAVRTRPDGEWIEQTYSEFVAQIRHIANGLIGCGLQPGEAAAILAENRAEWLAAQYAVLSIGGVVVPLNKDAPIEEIGNVLRDTGARVAFVSNRVVADMFTTLRRRLPTVRLIVTFDDVPPELAAQSVAPLGWGSLQLDDPLGLDDWQLTTLARLLQVPYDLATSAESRRREESWRPTDVAFVDYTTTDSTGLMRGAVLSHGAVAESIEAMRTTYGLSDNIRTVTMLPLHHGIERVMAGVAFRAGGTLTCLEWHERYFPVLKEFHPNVIFATSMVMRAVAQQIHLTLLRDDRVYAIGWGAARAIGARCVAARRAGAQPQWWLRMARPIADALVLRRARDCFGGYKRATLLSGAELSPELTDYLTMIGITPWVVWGQLETGVIVTGNTGQAQRSGSAGRAVDGVQIRIGSDSEVLVRGPSVMRGYFGLPRETRKALRDGWIHTGQVGRIDDDGFLHLTHRLDDVIVTGALEHISPRLIEDRLQEEPLVAEASVIGNDRPCLTALVSPDFAQVRQRIRRSQHRLRSDAELMDDPTVVRFYGDLLREINASLPADQRIRAFRLVVQPAANREAGVEAPKYVRRRRTESENAAYVNDMYEALAATSDWRTDVG